jgi:hypothetical protein
MMKFLFVTPIIFLSLPTLSLDINASLGSGARHAGGIGAQLIVSQHNHAVRGALGFLGVSAGYDYKITEKISLGVTYGSFGFIPLTGPLIYGKAKTLDVTYYFSGEYTSGWSIGLDGCWAMR